MNYRRQWGDDPETRLVLHLRRDEDETSVEFHRPNGGLWLYRIGRSVTLSLSLPFLYLHALVVGPGFGRNRRSSHYFGRIIFAPRRVGKVEFEFGRSFDAGA